MTWPLGPLSGSTADTDSRVVPGWAPSNIFSVKLETPKGRKRGALSLTSSTFMVSLAVFHKENDQSGRRQVQRDLSRKWTDHWGRCLTCQ